MDLTLSKPNFILDVMEIYSKFPSSLCILLYNSVTNCKIKFHVKLVSYGNTVHTVNWEIFVYENIHVLNINFQGCPMKICQVEITVHVSPIKRLLATYASLLCYKTAKCTQIRAVCYPLQLEVSAHARKPFPIDNALHDGC